MACQPAKRRELVERAENNHARPYDWLRDPTGLDTLLGGAGTTHLLVLGAIGFVLLGTLYHVVPFIVWIHQYSDLLGYEPVPMIDDLYDDRLAAVDFTLVLTGTAMLVTADAAEVPAVVTGAGGLLVTAGVVVFITNMLLALHRHGPQSVLRIVFGTLVPGAEHSTPPAATDE